MTTDAPNNVTPIRHKTKDEKRIDARRKELLASGIKEEQVEGVLAQEEFRRLPIDQKVNFLMDSIHNAQRIYNETIRELAGEMVALRQNQEAIADAFDVNLKALEKVLGTLGVSEETLKSILEKVTQEFLTEKAAQQAAKKDPEKAVVEQEISHSIAEESAGVVITSSVS